MIKMLTANEIRKKYKATLFKGPSLYATCDVCKKKIYKTGDKQIYTYGYQTQYCSKCIVPVVKADLKRKQSKKRNKLKINMIKKGVNPQIKKVRKAIKKRL